MSIAVGPISQVSVGSNTAQLSVAAASGGTGPYTYQWYRSTTSGFTPGAGNLISGATGLTLSDSGLVPNTIYYYEVIATDSTSATGDSAQLAVTTTPQQLSPNQFAQVPIGGMIDMRFPYNSVSVQIDVSQATPLYPGMAVKMVNSANGVPKVVGIAANTDEVLGFINFDIKTVAFVAGSMAEISMAGNVIYLYSAGAIARGAQVVPALPVAGAVQQATGSTDANIVGWAFDQAPVAGSLIRVFLQCPSFAFDG
jgi:hypothetical protein